MMADEKDPEKGEKELEEKKSRGRDIKRIERGYNKNNEEAGNASTVLKEYGEDDNDDGPDEQLTSLIVSLEKKNGTLATARKSTRRICSCSCVFCVLFLLIAATAFALILVEKYYGPMDLSWDMLKKQMPNKKNADNATPTKEKMPSDDTFGLSIDKYAHPDSTTLEDSEKLNGENSDVLNSEHTISKVNDKQPDSNGKGYPEFECPQMFVNSPDSFESKHYLLSPDRVEEESTFLEQYRKSTYDHCHTTYEKLKEELYDWKVERFAANLKDGDTIYESASGLGLNLVLTLEIIQEVSSISNLVVYGNDYVPESVLTSNKLMDEGILPSNGKKGLVCQGDSAHLTWVPDKSFDLVFTGFLAPLQNPLDLDLDVDDLWKRYGTICRQKNQHQIGLVKKMTKKQEDWYGQWVSEMIRIAKPGAPVIIEQVTHSVCTFWDDWGGVDKDFWLTGIDEYGWDIDVDSIAMENVKGNRSRYNVFMRKNL